MTLSRRQSILLLLPFLIIVVPFLIIPALFGALVSFTGYQTLHPGLDFVGFRNYARVLGDDLFRTAVANTFLLVVVTVPLELILGVGLALALRHPFRGRALVRFALLLPWMISPAASGVLWHHVWTERTGLLSYLTALLELPPPRLFIENAFLTMMAAEIWRKAPLVTFLFLPGVLAIASDQWDNARLDGLGLWSRFRHIVYGRLRLLLLTILLLLTADALGTSESILFLTGGGPGTSTLTLGLYGYRYALTAQNWSLGTASSLLIAVAVLILGLGYLRWTRQTTSET